MKLKTIAKSIMIAASKERVWSVLLDEEYTRVWYKHFSEGAHAVTDWKEGSKALFFDETGFGLISTVIENIPYQLIDLEHQGVLFNGKEDLESDLAKGVKGAKETYHLTEITGGILLAIKSDMDESYFESMSKSWENALANLKLLAENK